MATSTDNYHLKKPAKTDFYNVDDFNNNMDIIDENMKRIDDKGVPTKVSDLTNDLNFISDANYHHTDENFTNTLKTKLNGIADNAEVNTINSINVNNEPVTPTAQKAVNLTIPDELKGSTYTILSSSWTLNASNFFECSITNANININTFVDVVMDIPNQQKMGTSSVISYNGGFKIITSKQPIEDIDITYTYQLVNNS